MTNRKTDMAVEEDQRDVQARRKSGEFVRGISTFRNKIGDPEFPPEPDRYHLFVSFNCPWSHRASMARGILGLENSITMDVAFPNRTDEEDPAGPNLWMFEPTKEASLTGMKLPECTAETGTGRDMRLVKEIYSLENSTQQSVPVLYDKKQKCIVNNESADIIRMLDQCADELESVLPPDIRPKLYPEDEVLRTEIDSLNELIYVNINNGAYKAGFSSDQQIYASAFAAYFETLQELNTRLASDNRPFLTGEHFTEADLRLFPTLFRHDPIYYIRMKLNGARILDYPHLWRWLCRVYELQGVKASNSLVHCRQGYFGRSWNKTIPLGPIKPMTYPEAYEYPGLCDTPKHKTEA